MNHIKVEGEPDIVRDVRSNAIISVDKDAYAEFKERMAEKRESANRLTRLEDRMENLEHMLSRILDKLS
jgi:hypothetical protein